MSKLTQQNANAAWRRISNMLHPKTGKPILRHDRLGCFQYLCDHAWDEERYGIGISRPDLQCDWDFNKARRLSDLPVLGLAIEVGSKPSRIAKTGEINPHSTCTAYHPVLPSSLPELDELLNRVFLLDKAQAEERKIKARLNKQYKEHKDDGLLLWEDSAKRMCDEIEQHIIPYIEASYTPCRAQLELLRRLNLAIQRGRSRTPLDPKKPRSRQ